MPAFTESVIEEAAIGWFTGLGYSYAYGKELDPEGAHPERTSFSEVVLAGRLKSALAKLNPAIPASALEDAFRKITRLSSPGLISANREFHRALVNGITVEYSKNGRVVGDTVRLFDFEDIEANDWLAVNQFTVIEDHHQRRPDVVVFVNGLPLAVLELKNAADENATIWSAFNQLQTYKQQIPSLMAYNEALVISDGLEARVGSLSADRERFMPWKTIEGDRVADNASIKLEVLLKGFFDRQR
ncbi:MAG: type I restriction endonuclease, partial [Anaerolineaceae bacterium]